MDMLIIISVRRLVFPSILAAWLLLKKTENNFTGSQPFTINFKRGVSCHYWGGGGKSRINFYFNVSLSLSEDSSAQDKQNSSQQKKECIRTTSHGAPCLDYCNAVSVTACPLKDRQPMSHVGEKGREGKGCKRTSLMAS